MGQDLFAGWLRAPQPSVAGCGWTRWSAGRPTGVVPAPVPVSATVLGLLVALLVTVRLPVRVPDRDDGV